MNLKMAMKSAGRSRADIYRSTRCANQTMIAVMIS
jgi:hypothetical protein